MTSLSRGEFLTLMAGAFVGQAIPATRADRVARVIQEYDAQGIHRTATDVDDRSARWLGDAARSAGADVQLDAFPLERVDVRSAYVEADGHRIEGLPFFDGSFTTATGIVGKLNADIALATIDTAGVSSEGQSLEKLRRSADHRGIVAVTNAAHPGLSPSNAASFRSPYGVPVLQVASGEQRWLADRAASGGDVRLVVDASRTPSRGLNVVATVSGTNSALHPLVVMTPRSGWWHCASERGGGLACWIEAIRGVAARRPARSLIAIASSGHELGHFGLDAFLEKRAFVMNQTIWIHLGANIGAARGVPRLQASDDEMEATADAALTRAGTAVRQRLPRGTRPGGEARNIHDAGGRYISLLGNGPFFHNIADRWPAAVDIDAVSRFAEAFADLAVRLTALS